MLGSKVCSSYFTFFYSHFKWSIKTAMLWVALRVCGNPCCCIPWWEDEGSVACVCSVLKSSLPCQNLFIGIFSISGSLEPCICFPLVASVNMMSFFLIILKYCILNEKIAHSFKGLINCWKMICSLCLMLFFVPIFLPFSVCFIPFLWASLAHLHTKLNVFPCKLCCTQTEKCLLFSPTVSPSLPCTLSGRAQLTCVLGTLEVPGTREG